MNKIIVSEDQNMVTDLGVDHVFDEGIPEKKPCQECSLLSRCIELQETVENEFPYPCLEENREDKRFGNFRKK